MIRIKDYIFNENEIREIKQCKNYLRLDLTYSGPYLHIDDATFEDIEWNYGTKKQIRTSGKKGFPLLNGNFCHGYGKFHLCRL